MQLERSEQMGYVLEVELTDFLEGEDDSRFLGG